jgi:hypothetical protein
MFHVTATTTLCESLSQMACAVVAWILDVFGGSIMLRQYAWSGVQGAGGAQVVMHAPCLCLLLTILCANLAVSY